MAVAFLATRPQCEWSFYWDAFDELCSERPLGFGATGPIPGSAIREYCREFDLTQHESNALRYVVRVLDARQRAIAAEKAEKQRKKNAN